MNAVPSESIVGAPLSRRLLHAVLAALFGTAVVSLLVSFWGWDNFESYIAHPARAGTLILVPIRIVAAFWRPVFPARGKGIPGKKVRERGFFPLLCAAALLALASPWFDRHERLLLPGGDLLRYVGLALFICGTALATWAQYHLGTLFSGYVTVQTGHRLVTDGPFRYLRHPRYAGLMLLFIGLALVFLSAVGLMGALVFAVVIASRIPREERLLAAEFGDEWTQYQRRTRRLLPFGVSP